MQTKQEYTRYGPATRTHTIGLIITPIIINATYQFSAFDIDGVVEDGEPKRRSLLFVRDVDVFAALVLRGNSR